MPLPDLAAITGNLREERAFEREETERCVAHVRLQGGLRHRRAERREEDRPDEDAAERAADHSQPGGGDARHQEEKRRQGIDEIAVADEAAAAVPVEGDEGQKEQRDSGESADQPPALR